MNVRKKQKVMSIVSVSLFVIAIGMFVWYEFGGGRSALNYSEILVLTEPAIQGQTINESMLQVSKVDKDLIQEGYISSANQIEGLEAKHYIPANTPLISNYFADSDVVLNEGQYVAQIPKSWITSVPQSLRRGDNVVLYATQILSDSVTSKSITTNEEGEMVVVEKEAEQTTGESKLVKLFETTVAYVKDSANAEVVTTSTEDRKNASSNIASVEIITTTEEFKKIEQQVNAGSFLIIMYTDAQATEQKKEESEETE